MDVQLAVTILLISTTSKLTTSQNLLPLQQDETGYTTSIIHQNPLSPDQQAESAINFRFGPNDVSQFNPQDDAYNVAFLQTPSGANQPDEYPVQIIENPRSLHYTPRQNNPNSHPSQSFNVGYSVKFAGGAPALPVKQHKQQEQIFLNSDIITGINKEEVMKPREEFVLNSLLDSKKQKISGIKPKYHRPLISTIDPEILLAQANLSPKTQMKLQELQGNSRLPNYDSDPYLKKANNSPWKTLSPGVEIYRSKPIRTISSEPAEESKRFDHAKALGRSIGFDYTNVVDMKPFDDPYVIKDIETKSEEDKKFNQYGSFLINNEDNSDLVKEPVSLTETDQRQEQDTAYTTNPEMNFNYYQTKSGNNLKSYTNSPSFNYAFNQPQVIYANPKPIFNKRQETVTKFPQQNPDSVFGGYNEGLKQFQGQYGYPTPLIDLTQTPGLQQYSNQPAKIAKTRGSMYSVKENLQDDIKPLENQVGNKLYGKNYVYVPYPNMHGNNYHGGIKKIRPNGIRYINNKDSKKYLRPHTRSKMHPRIEMY